MALDQQDKRRRAMARRISAAEYFWQTCGDIIRAAAVATPKRLQARRKSLGLYCYLRAAAARAERVASAYGLQP
jgi:hypothetical protein